MLLAAFCSACQGLSSFGAGFGSDEGDLIRFGNAVRGYSSETLESQYARSVSAQAADPSAENAIRLALLLSYPGAPFYDIARARGFLGEALARGGESDAVELARLLDKLLAERHGVTGDAAMLADLFTEERERSYRLGFDLAEARAALDAERALRITLQGQLDALKALEERLNADDRP